MQFLRSPTRLLVAAALLALALATPTATLAMPAAERHMITAPDGSPCEMISSQPLGAIVCYVKGQRGLVNAVTLFDFDEARRIVYVDTFDPRGTLFVHERETITFTEWNARYGRPRQ